MGVNCRGRVGEEHEELKVMLIQRDLEPHQGQWALPGGFVRVDETLEGAARRELEEETGLHKVFLEQLYTFGAVERDPRERVVTVAYYALVKLSDHRVQATTDRLRSKVRYQPVGFELLPKKFTLSQLQHLYELVLERELDERNFRKRLLAMDLLFETDEVEPDVAHRAARLYRFDERKYKRLAKAGFHFEL